MARFDRFGGVGKEIVGRMEKSQDLGGTLKREKKLLRGREKKVNILRVEEGIHNWLVLEKRNLRR